MTRSEFITSFKLNYTPLLNFAKQLTKNVNDAEDLVQETAIKAFRFRDAFRDGSSFKSWTFTILKNSFITKYRKRRRRDTVTAPQDTITYLVDKSSNVNNAAVSNLKVDEIINSIDRLSQKSRLPLQQYIKGYSYKEIATKLDIPIGTVKSRINFARKKLKQHLVEQGNIAA